MFTRQVLGRVAVAAVVAAILVAGTVALVERGAGPAGSGPQLTPPISRPVDASQLTGPQADSTLDPGFTGGLPQQPNMGTKPPRSSAAPGTSASPVPSVSRAP
jgi:hypothetical protein